MLRETIERYEASNAAVLSSNMQVIAHYYSTSYPASGGKR